VETVGHIPVSDLVKGYRRHLGLDVSACFSGMDKLLEKHCAKCDLRYFLPVVTGDERFYATLSAKNWYYMEEKPEFAMARRYVGRDDRVLEAGAGRGAFARNCPGGYRGLEFNRAAAEQAKRDGVEVLVEPLEAHAARHAGAYDVTCAFQVLEHVADPRGFVGMLARLTRPGGRIIVSVPNEDGLPGETMNAFLNLPPHHVTRWSPRALTALSEGAGLALEAIEYESVASFHLGWHVAQRLCRRIAPGLVARPGRRVRMDRRGYLAWRTLWLLGAVSARFLRPLFRSSAKTARGHTAIAIMRKA
jgi:SAM-dependent methyltransferase